MPVIEAIKKHATKPLDVHLMIIEPDKYIQTFANLGVTNLTVHLEAYTPAPNPSGYQSCRYESRGSPQSSHQY